MTTTYTLHTVDCASALELDAPTVNSADYPAARWHRCGYYTTPKPDQARMTSTEDVVPAAGPKKRK